MYIDYLVKKARECTNNDGHVQNYGQVSLRGFPWPNLVQIVIGKIIVLLDNKTWNKIVMENIFTYFFITGGKTKYPL